MNATHAAPETDDTDAGIELNDEDRAILVYPEKTIAEGTDLVRWWKSKHPAGEYAERFDVMREYITGNNSPGFFDVATVGGRDMPVMGIVQDMFYDRQRPATGTGGDKQLEEFVLRYFMRVSHLRLADVASASDGIPRRTGFGYEQLYYKRHDTGAIGKFPESQRSAIVDLREIGPVYDWIVLKVNIFDFTLKFSPFGVERMRFQLPLKESTYLVMGPSFITNEETPEPGVRARYGFGYAFVPYAPDPNDVVAYGPGHFAAAIQTVEFSLLDTGEIRVRAAFVVNRPDKIVKMDIAPLDWGFRLANLMTMSLASKVMKPAQAVADHLPLRINGIDPISGFIALANTVTGGKAHSLGISKSVLERLMLVQHFHQHYEMLMGSMLIWRRIPDWTDHDNLPPECQGTRC